MSNLVPLSPSHLPPRSIRGYLPPDNQEVIDLLTSLAAWPGDPVGAARRGLDWSEATGRAMSTPETLVFPDLTKVESLIVRARWMEVRALLLGYGWATAHLRKEGK